MTDHYFEHPFAQLHYYKFGKGENHMLCFHGYGMHGKQFSCLEESFGDKYTFWGFDLFFHKETKLSDQSLAAVKTGLAKKQLAALINDFCRHNGIERFSVIGYSMGSHYATALTEELPQMIDAYVVAAPSSIHPGNLVRYFGKNRAGNKILEKIVLTENVIYHFLNLCKWLRFIDATGRDILYKEVGTPELRFALYACFTYLRHLETDQQKLIKVLREYQIKSIFIFGKRDRMYLPAIGKAFFSEFTPAEVLILDEDHEMINSNFAHQLSRLLV